MAERFSVTAAVELKKRINRGIRVGAIIVAVVFLLVGVQAFLRYREINSVPPLPPDLCFPEQSTSDSRALEGEFEILTRVKRLPANVQPAFKERNGNRWAIANPGEKFEATDVITDRSLPGRRSIFAGRSPEVTFVQYEQGGWALWYDVAAFRTASLNIDPLWKRHCPRPADNLEDLRSMIAAGQCPTNRGFTCANDLR